METKFPVWDGKKLQQYWRPGVVREVAQGHHLVVEEDSDGLRAVPLNQGQVRLVVPVTVGY